MSILNDRLGGFNYEYFRFIGLVLVLVRLAKMTKFQCYATDLWGFPEWRDQEEQLFIVLRAGLPMDTVFVIPISIYFLLVASTLLCLCVTISVFCKSQYRS